MGNTDASEVCNCTCSCVNRVVKADLEGLKLDMTILESRLFAQCSSKLDNWGAHIHIFVFCVINFF
jgi:hypothetical protein